MLIADPHAAVVAARVPLLRAWRVCLAYAGAGAALLTLCACAGHGAYTRQHVEQAKLTMAQMKSGSEWQMGQQQFLAGDLDKALKSVDKSLAISPNVAKSHVLRGRILLEKGQLEAANAALLRAEALAPDNVEAQYYLGIVHERFSEPEESLSRYLAAVRLDPANPQYLIAAAEMMVQLNRLEQAQALLEERRSAFQYNAAVRQTLGHIAMIRNDPHKAASLFNEALLLAPDDMAIMEDLTNAQIACEMFAEAEFNIERLLAAPGNENRRDLLQLQARCLIAVDRVVEARSILLTLTADSQGSNDPRTWTLLGRVCCTLNDTPRLRMVAARVIAMAPDRFEGYYFKAAHLRGAGDLAGAVDALAEASQHAPKNADLLVLRAMIQQDMGRRDDARASLAAAVQLDPTNESTRALLAALEAGKPITSHPEGGR